MQSRKDPRPADETTGREQNETHKKKSKESEEAMRLCAHMAPIADMIHDRIDVCPNLHRWWSKRSFTCGISSHWCTIIKLRVSCGLKSVREV